MILGDFPQIPPEKAQVGRYIALDCEVVKIKPPYTDKMEMSLARVSVVNFHGDIIIDVFVKQVEPVEDYLTAVSGIRPGDLDGPNSVSIRDVRKKVEDLFKGRVLIGHTLSRNLKTLFLAHDHSDTVDIQTMLAIRSKYNSQEASLRELTRRECGVDIEDQQRSSVLKARASMAIFRLYKHTLTLLYKRKREESNAPDRNQRQRQHKTWGDEAALQIVDDSSKETRKGEKVASSRPGKRVASARSEVSSDDWWSQLGSQSTQGRRNQRS
ncbi:ribonuclease H-like domain-containing protein [Cantharellus anzutake]|uniref:ribonuclease H-like domain-containing protein n=1 Tax=Cantharellus anzutake TaxID=1750568 RepID=UPI0019033E7E|nr:ribonuclease H-like domain-containing protein [Cantharellus anzutake]KAF8343149.1 ribonuclease H-like domain-containing protein [Cantharellus anzutake]